jgi:ribonuclease HI
MLVLRQVKGEYKVNAENLRPYCKTARKELTKLGELSSSVLWDHVERKLNADADALANKAMDLESSGEVWHEEAVDILED